MNIKCPKCGHTFDEDTLPPKNLIPTGNETGDRRSKEFLRKEVSSTAPRNIIRFMEDKRKGN